MHRTFSAFAISLLLTGCAASEESKGTASSGAPEVTQTEGAEPEGTETASVDPTPEPVPTSSVTTSIASVVLVEDCPEPKNQADSAKKDKVKRKRSASSGPLVQPCTQSTVQLAFAGEVTAPTKVEIKAVRLVSTAGKALGILETRLPSLWQENGYAAWDGILPKGPEAKVSYKLSVPNWSELETALGGSSFGVMYTLEIDVEVAGKPSTLTSPQFERGRRQIIKT